MHQAFNSKSQFAGKIGLSAFSDNFINIVHHHMPHFPLNHPFVSIRMHVCCMSGRAVIRHIALHLFSCDFQTFPPHWTYLKHLSPEPSCRFSPLTTILIIIPTGRQKSMIFCQGRGRTRTMTNSSWHLLKINRESSYLSVRGTEGARDTGGKTEMQRCINKKRGRQSSGTDCVTV